MMTSERVIKCTVRQLRRTLHEAFSLPKGWKEPKGWCTDLLHMAEAERSSPETHPDIVHDNLYNLLSACGVPRGDCSVLLNGVGWSSWGYDRAPFAKVLAAANARPRPTARLVVGVHSHGALWYQAIPVKLIDTEGHMLTDEPDPQPIWAFDTETLELKHVATLHDCSRMTCARLSDIESGRI